MTPTVSVVVTTYNYARFLPFALESVLGQTFDDLEVVVVDDGSTDNTQQVIRPYLRDRRVRYFLRDHRGVVATKNAGIQLARAPYVAFLDADDVWLPTKLEEQLALFRTDPDLGVVYSRRLLIDEEGFELVYEQPPLFRGDILEPLFQTNCVCFSSALVARRVFDRVGLINPAYPTSEDYEFWLRVARQFRFDYVDTPLVQYRTGHASLSRRIAIHHNALAIMRRFLDEMGGRALLSRSTIRVAFAETRAHLALSLRDRSRLQAVGWYLRALASCPTFGPAWLGLASLFLTESLRRRLRRVLGKPADWATRPRLADVRPDRTKARRRARAVGSCP